MGPFVGVPYRSVIPNRGAAAHKGAVSKCQGCRQMLKFLDLYTYETS